MKITITEIRSYLKSKNATIKKEGITLNGNAAYKVQYEDGGYTIDTIKGIKERYELGTL